MSIQTGVVSQLNASSMIDRLPAVIFEYTILSDGSRDFTYLSPRCEEILGVSRIVLMRGVFRMKNYIHQEDWEDFQLSSQNSITGLKEWKWEGRVNTPHKTIWIEASAVPNPQVDGSVILSGLITDVSGRKELEQQQRDMEKQYRDLVEHLPMGVGIYTDQKLVYVNGYAFQMMAAKKEEDLIGHDAMDFVHPHFKEAVSARLKSVVMGFPILALEHKFLRIDGKEIDVEVTAYPFQYLGKSAVQLLVKDITDRKHAEVIMKKTETLFSQLFQSSPMAITMLDEKGNVVQVNKGFEDLFGYVIDELKGKGLNQFIVPEELEAEGNDLNSLITTYQVIRTESMRRKKDGTILTVLIYGVPVRMDEKTIGIFGVYVDITERKKVEEELKIRNTELDNFVYKVSHDLRAPLSSILGLVNLAKMPNNDDNPHMYIDLIGQKVEQLDHFISDVLSHSKNLKMDLKVAKVNFKGLIDQTFTNLSHMKGAGETKRTVTISSKDFYSDPWRIAEIFRNLVSNAIKYRNLKITEPSIDIDITIDDSHCHIIFKDNGIGIGQASLSKIFDMFYRASEQSEGSGLGLYIVKNAADKMGGEVTVDSELGKGTAFRISLPNLSHYR